MAPYKSPSRGQPVSHDWTDNRKNLMLFSGRAHPELAEIFGQLNPRLTNEVMLKLNAEVDNEGRDPALVARDWLIEEGLLSAPS